MRGLRRCVPWPPSRGPCRTRTRRARRRPARVAATRRSGPVRSRQRDPRAGPPQRAPPPAPRGHPPRMRTTLRPQSPPEPPPSAWAGGAVREPGGVFPSGPPRPIYREPTPVSSGALAIGAGSAALWMLLFGLLATTARSYAWLSFGAGAAAWLSALVLSRFGDRGVAAGVALSSAVGVAIAGIVVTVRWAGGHWLLWEGWLADQP